VRKKKGRNSIPAQCPRGLTATTTRTEKPKKSNIEDEKVTAHVSESNELGALTKTADTRHRPPKKWQE
jgi:hypothetical protein